MKTNIATSFLISLVLHITILYSFFALYPVKIRIAQKTLNIQIVSAPGAPEKTTAHKNKDGELKPANKYYTVNKGDTLWDLSEKFLNDPYRWAELFEDNPQLKDPHVLYAGSVIRMPKSRMPKSTFAVTETPITEGAMVAEAADTHGTDIQLKAIKKTKALKKTVTVALKKEPAAVEKAATPKKSATLTKEPTKPPTKKTAKKKTVTAKMEPPTTTILTDDRKLVKNLVKPLQPKVLKKPKKPKKEDTVDEETAIEKAVVEIAKDEPSEKEKTVTAKAVTPKKLTTPTKPATKPTAKKKTVTVKLFNNDEYYKKQPDLKEPPTTTILTDDRKPVEPLVKPLQPKVLKKEEAVVKETVVEEAAIEKVVVEIAKDEPSEKEKTVTAKAATPKKLTALIKPTAKPTAKKKPVAATATLDGELNKKPAESIAEPLKEPLRPMTPIKPKKPKKEETVAEETLVEEAVTENQTVTEETATEEAEIEETAVDKIVKIDNGETVTEEGTAVLKTDRDYKISKKTGTTKHTTQGREYKTGPVRLIKDTASLLTTEGGGKGGAKDQTAIAVVNTKANTHKVGTPEAMEKTGTVTITGETGPVIPGNSGDNNNNDTAMEEPSLSPPKDKDTSETLTAQGDTPSPQVPETPTTGSHKKTKHDDGNTTDKGESKETVAAVVVEENTGGFLLTNDIIISVFLNELNLDHMDFKLSSEPHPSSRKRRRLTTGKSKQDVPMRKLVLKKSKKVFALHRAKNAVYYFTIANTGTTKQTTSLTFLLYGGKDAKRTKEIKDITISGQDSVTFKFVMPETTFWSDDEVFTGTIEGPDTITKYNEELGLVWTEDKK